MSKPVCHIFAAGEFSGPAPVIADGDFVIAADGGYARVLELGLRADLLVGDFDSLSHRPDDVETVVLPVEKDVTDTAAAIAEGFGRGYRAFSIYGGTGGQLDHTLANIQCVAGLAQRGARGFLRGGCVVTAVHNGGIRFPAGCSGRVSVFSHGEMATGVCLTGLKYPLENATLRNTFPLGVSNEFTGAACSISVRDGTLIAIYPETAREIE